MGEVVFAVVEVMVEAVGSATNAVVVEVAGSAVVEVVAVAVVVAVEEKGASISTGAAGTAEMGVGAGVKTASAPT